LIGTFDAPLKIPVTIDRCESRRPGRSMRLFLIVILGGVLSFAAGLGVTLFASRVLPCFDDAASCRMGEVYGVVGTTVYAPVAMIAFGLALLMSRREPAIGIALLVLLLPVVGYRRDRDVAEPGTVGHDREPQARAPGALAIHRAAGLGGAGARVRSADVPETYRWI
jgi:hypothetical protein